MRCLIRCLFACLLIVLVFEQSVYASMRFRSSSIKDTFREANTSSVTSGSNVNPTTGIFCGGTLSTAMNCEQFRGRIPTACQVQRVDATVTTAPAGSSIILDVNECSSPTSCTSIWTSSQSDRLDILAGATSGKRVSYFEDQSIALGNYVGFDIDAVGSTTAGSNLTVTLVCQ